MLRRVENTDDGKTVARKIPVVAKGPPAKMQLPVQLCRALQQLKLRLQKGLILNELVGCERSLVFFEAFTTEESVMQLGLQKMHNVKARKNTATISATLFKAKNNKEKSKSINTKKRWTQKIGQV